MFEFGARIILAGGLVFFAGTTGNVGFSLAIGVAVALGAMAVAAHALQAKGLYEGAGASLHGGLESLALAMLLVDAGLVESLGFLALAPYAWASVRRRAPWTAGSFAVSFALVSAYALVARREPTTGLLLQAGGALVIGLLLALRTDDYTVDVETALPIAEDGELRGRFRALREAYSVLETRASRDVHTSAIARAATPDAMAQTVRDATDATGAALFAPVDEGWQAIGRAGVVPEELDAPFRSARSLQERGATLLFAAGRAVGAAWVPEASRDALAGVSEILSTRLADRMAAEAERRKRRAAELRVELIEGGDSPDAVARAVAALVGADSVEFGSLSAFGATPLGRFGPPCGLPSALRHESGPGLDGWATAGTPTVWISDARRDERLDDRESLRARTAALALISLADGRAYAWAAWHTTGVAHPTALGTMRAAETMVLRWVGEATTYESARLAA